VDLIIGAVSAADAFIRASLEVLGRDVIADVYCGGARDSQFAEVEVVGRVESVPSIGRKVTRLSLRERAEMTSEVEALRTSAREERERLALLDRNRSLLDRLMLQVFGDDAEYEISEADVWGERRFVAELRWDSETTLTFTYDESPRALASHLHQLVGIEYCRECRWHEPTRPVARLQDVLREIEVPPLARHRCDRERLEEVAERDRAARAPRPYWVIEGVNVTGGLCVRFTGRDGESFDIDNRSRPYLARVSDDKLRAISKLILAALNSAAPDREV
jgi:hypothetical protein